MWSPVLQWFLGPAGFHRDYRDHDSYVKYSQFLAYLNNERIHPDSNKYKERFEQLNSLTLVKFIYDPVVFPIESSWFGEIDSRG